MKVHTLSYVELLEAAREFLNAGRSDVAKVLIREYWNARWNAELNRSVVSFPKSIRFGV